jgi:predicted nucleic acid-binding protein
MGTILITDASVLINLVASGAAGEILSGCGMEFKVCPDVIREVKVLRDRETGKEHSIDLEPFFTAGTLERIEPQTDSEFELLIDYAGLLGAGDGEAMCFALAESRGHPIAIDDERAIRRAKKRNPTFKTLGTLEILILWQARNGIADERMGELLQSIFRLARFRPAVSHPHYAYWQRCWGWG